MSIKSLLEDCLIAVDEGDAVAGQGTLTGEILDMAGYESVCFIALLGDVTTTCALELHAEGGDATMSDAAELAGNAGGAAGASDADEHVLILDVVKPRERYIRAVLERGTANAVVGGIISIRYNGKKSPVTADDTVFDSQLVISPADA